MLEIFFSGLMSLAVAILAFVVQGQIKENHKLKIDKSDASNAKYKALENGVLCLLRSDLISCYTKCIDTNSISTREYENWSLMYTAYKELGGNGMITHMNSDIEELKMKQ